MLKWITVFTALLYCDPAQANVNSDTNCVAKRGIYVDIGIRIVNLWDNYEYFSPIGFQNYNYKANNPVQSYALNYIFSPTKQISLSFGLEYANPGVSIVQNTFSIDAQLASSRSFTHKYHVIGLNTGVLYCLMPKKKWLVGIAAGYYGFCPNEYQNTSFSYNMHDSTVILTTSPGYKYHVFRGMRRSSNSPRFVNLVLQSRFALKEIKLKNATFFTFDLVSNLQFWFVVNNRDELMRNASSGCDLKVSMGYRF